MTWKMKTTTLTLLLSTLFVLSGCGNDDDNSAQIHQYEITVTNLTAGQPLSPAGIVLHGSGYTPFTVGQSASMGIETMAEGGDLTTFLADATASDEVTATASGTGIIVPGGDESVTVESTNAQDLSIVSMLVNTNDAFIALNGGDIADMQSGEERIFYLNAYDAGTEQNSEAGSDIPGPAGGGEGFNAARESNDIITLHPGVITSDDGFAGSSLSTIHKWDNPTAIVTITRKQ